MKKKLMALMLSGILFLQSAGMAYGAEFLDGAGAEVYSDSEEQNEKNTSGESVSKMDDVLKEFSDNNENAVEEQFSGGTDEEENSQKKISDEENDAVSATASALQTSGTCGKNLKWELDNETLTISGKGEMDSYSIWYRSCAPWYTTVSNIKEIVIKQGVTSIGSEAFRECSRLTSITIPNSVTSIGNSAFQDCTSLISMTIPSNITNIENGTFEGCSGLTRITIPNSVTNIGEFAFEGCSGLTGITIPNSVTRIMTCAFGRCSRLTSITVPNGVISIESNAFASCSGLRSVTLSSSVTSIGSCAFGRCSRLTSITIPNSVTSIGDGAFQNCTSLTSIMIPRNVMNIEDYTFYNCSSLTSIIIPNTVMSIGHEAFGGCRSLTSITIPSSVTSIGSAAFRECSRLTSITIPNSVTSIGDSVFRGCTSLTSITIPNSVTYIGGYAFANCSGLTKITIPNSVTYIGGHAFANCSGLTKITIPNNVTSIEYGTFDGCRNLTDIIIPNSVTSIERWAFWECSGLIDVYYKGSEMEWKKIRIYSENECLTNAKIHYNSSAPSSTFDVSNAKVSSLKKSYEYTGKTIKPVPKVTLKNKVLTSNQDYKVSYKNNKNVGTATITIKGIGKYSGTKTVKFQIVVTPKLDNLKTTYTIKSGKKQNTDTVKIAEKGELIVDGSLTAKEIYVNKGGKLIINAGGTIESGTVIVQGGKVSGGGSLKNSGLLKTYKLTVKDTGIISMDGSAQTIVYNEFNMSTSSNKSSFKAGELFIDGSFILNGNAKNFVADESGTLKTIFCNSGNNTLTAKSNKYNLGTVCVASQEAYNALNLKAQNYNSALIYIGLKKPNQKKWSYTLTGKKLSIGASEWGVLIGNLYQQASMNSAYVVTDSHLTETERKFVESIASVWVNTIQTPLNKGLNEYSSKKCQMEFKVGKHNCTLTCNMDGYGSYGLSGSVNLKVDNGAEEVIGMIAAGSIESFKAQATVYLAEGYIKEYYKFTTGTALKTVTSKTNSAKLAGKFLEKIVDKYCFQSLKTSTTEEVKQLKKVFKVVKYLGKAV